MQRLREKGMKLREIGKRFGITQERVRQILCSGIKTSICKKHPKIHFIEKCRLCKVEEDRKKFKVLLKESSKQSILDEIRRLQGRGRTKNSVLRRCLLVRLLRDKYKLSFLFIGRLLNRHYSTIIHYYYGK